MKRGPKSAAALAIVNPIREVRPAPPDRLTDAEVEVWRMTVDRLPASWFKAEHLPLLEAYCAHVAAGRRFTAMLDLFESDWIKVEGGLDRLNKLSMLRERESRAATAIARSLRITKASQTEPRTAFRGARDAPVGPRPWDGYDFKP